MQRTPEQKSADDALTEAVNAVVDAYGFREDGMVNTNYMVIIEQIGFADDGESRTGIVRVSKDGDMPWPAIFGLLRCATLGAERAFIGNGSDSTD